MSDEAVAEVGVRSSHLLWAREVYDAFGGSLGDPCVPPMQYSLGPVT